MVSHNNTPPKVGRLRIWTITRKVRKVGTTKVSGAQPTNTITHYTFASSLFSPSISSPYSCICYSPDSQPSTAQDVSISVCNRTGPIPSPRRSYCPISYFDIYIRHIFSSCRRTWSKKETRVSFMPKLSSPSLPFQPINRTRDFHSIFATFMISAYAVLVEFEASVTPVS